MEKIGIVFKAASMLVGGMVLSALLALFVFIICGQIVTSVRARARRKHRRKF